MGWSLKLGEVAGIRVQVHFTFLVFMALPVLSGLIAGQSQQVVLANAAFMLGLFGCVILHEFGHALTARRYGIRTKDITLLPIGGVARLERMPDDPRQELWVALAGPAVNVVIAAGLGIWLHLTRGSPILAGIDVAAGSFAERLLLVNSSLAVFNMLPAFPMDGGRVVRALLARRMEYARATRIAAQLGQGMALAAGVAGFFYNPILMFIAIFVWIGAAQESRMVFMKSALAGVPVSAAMMTRFETVAPGDSLEHLSRLILSGSQREFPVLDGNHVIGVVTRDGFLKALAQKDDLVVSEIMHEDTAVVDASDPLESTLQRLQTSGCQALLVLRNEQLVGLLTAENLGEFVMIRNARNGRSTPVARVIEATV